MSDIAPGLLLGITTWENDGDNYKTEQLPGLNADEVRFYLMIANLFRSGNRVADGIGNMPVFSSYERNSRSINHTPILDKMIADHLAAGGYVPDEWKRDPNEEVDEDDDSYFYSDLLGDLIGQSDYGHWRVFESFTVHQINETIPDVSAQFK
jgi:hypothetical protein